MQTIDLDESHLPIIFVTFKGTPSEADVQSFLARSNVGLGRREYYAMVFEEWKLTTLPAAQRRMFSDWIARWRELLGKYCVAQAYVMSSVMHRMMLRSVFMVQSLPSPYRIVSTRDEAERWCRERLEAAGASVPRAI